jgi:hypothetical protein
MSSTVDRAAAEAFIWRTARLLERHRYAYHFRGGDPARVLAALLAYQNPDGGFGNALEPDFRGVDSQPVLVHGALRVLDEIGQCRGPLGQQVCDYLASVTAPNGGVPAVLPSVREYPRAPWFNVDDAPPGSLLPTAGIAGLLHKNRVEHPWLDRATSFCWQAIAALEDTHPYEVEFCVTFLNNAPDRERATREADRLGRLVRERKLVALDPDRQDEAQIPPGYAAGEVHTPLDYAPTPASLARRWVSDEEITRHLHALEEAQGEDGGWYFNWRDWNPATTLEWRGMITLETLLKLRAYGRLP